jgi:hypothetical protein
VTISPKPLCIARLCLTTLNFLVKCSSQLAHTYVGLSIAVYTDKFISTSSRSSFICSQTYQQGESVLRFLPFGVLVCELSLASIIKSLQIQSGLGGEASTLNVFASVYNRVDGILQLVSRHQDAVYVVFVFLHLYFGPPNVLLLCLAVGLE